jgi:hypothetical protein
MRTLLLVWGVGVFCFPVFAQAPSKPIETTGRTDARLGSFDQLMIRFLGEQELPGAPPAPLP